MATMRSKYVPEEGLFDFPLILSTTMSVLVRATVMNYFRIPLNLIVVIILLKVSQRQSIAIRMNKSL